MSRATVIVSVVSTKGGAGKTTTAANLGGLAAALGQRVLLIDADMQPALTKFYALEHPPQSGMSEVISRGGIVKQSDIVATVLPNLWLLPSDLDEAGHIHAWLRDREDRLVLLKRAMRQPVIQEQFDLVIIDTQGAKGELQRTAAMAADLMLSPIKPDMLNYSEFTSGTLEMLESLNAMSDLMPQMHAGQLAIFVNAMPRTANARLIDEAIRVQFRSHPTIRLLDTKVPQANAYVMSRTMQLPVHALDTGNSPAGLVMHALLHESLPHLKGLWLQGYQSDNMESL